MSNNHKKYTEIFDYLSAPKLPSEPYPTIVFGRKDTRVADKLVQTVSQGLAGPTVITGGIGKDSGNLVDLGYDSEAAYLDKETVERAKKAGVILPKISLDRLARNGGENVRNSLDIFEVDGVAINALATIAHATSTRRLAAMAEHEKTKRGIDDTTFRIPTDYPFDPTNPIDQIEARDELLRLYEWPDKEWLLPQDDLPEDLVDFALDQRKK